MKDKFIQPSAETIYTALNVFCNIGYILAIICIILPPQLFCTGTISFIDGVIYTSISALAALIFVIGSRYTAKLKKPQRDGNHD